MNTNEETRSSLPEYGMKWHNFLIYFSLWASAVISLIGAYQYATGGYYNGNAKLVYLLYGGLKALDIAMAICCVGIAVFAIVTRFALAGYREDGPKKLMLLYGLNVVVSLLYMVLVSGITHMPFSTLAADGMKTLVPAAVMIAVNKSYYEKRAELFVY